MPLREQARIMDEKCFQQACANVARREYGLDDKWGPLAPQPAEPAKAPPLGDAIRKACEFYTNDAKARWLPLATRADALDSELAEAKEQLANNRALREQLQDAGIVEWDKLLSERDAARAEVEQLKRDRDAEVAGVLALRKRYGAREDETFPQFVERLAAEGAQLKAKLVDLKRDRDQGGKDCCALQDRLDELFVEHEKLKRGADARVLAMRTELLGSDTPWPLQSILSRLVDVAKHAQSDHDCDRHGWELDRGAIEAAREAVARIERLPASTGTATPSTSCQSCYGTRQVKRAGQVMECPDCKASTGPASGAGGEVANAKGAAAGDDIRARSLELLRAIYYAEEVTTSGIDAIGKLLADADRDVRAHAGRKAIVAVSKDGGR